MDNLEMEDQDIRRLRLAQLIKEKYETQAKFIAATGQNQGEISALLKNKSFGEKKARKIELDTGMPRGWLDILDSDDVLISSTSGAYSGPERRLNQADGILIPHYNAGGAMDNSLVLDGQAGVIKSWRVDHRWLRLNVRNHTETRNLCIVTGFGLSMKPLFNPGDPLLLDKGITTVAHEDAVYFFRIGNYGYIKTVQRIPTPTGRIIYRAKSKNPDYDSFDIVDGMDFEVFGKILTVWKSEQL